jgi:membrane fusion protein (multidrug efflux system)
MKKVKIAAVLLAGTVVLAHHPGCGSGAESGKREVSIGKEAALQPKSVSLARVTKRDFDRSIRFTGTLQPESHAGLMALVEGTIEVIPVEIGNRVERGQMLFRIRLVDYVLRVRQAESAIQVAEAAEQTARVNVEDAKREMLRMENLYREGSATEQMRDRARTEHDRATALLEQARSAVVQAKVGLETARQALEDCTVTAPYSGFITGKFREQGEYVRRGELVLEIMDLASLEAEVALPERFFDSVSPGSTVRIEVGSAGTHVDGEIVAVNPKIDPQTRTFLIKVRVKNEEERLKAGLFCSGLLELPPLLGAIAVPSAAVLNDEGRSYVWVAQAGEVKRRLIQVGVSAGGFAQATEGLEAGEQVVVEGLGGLMDGTPILLEE